MKRNKFIIGSTDKVDFPDLSLEDVACKVDTGARTSAIHCHHVRLIEKNGEEYLAFKLLDPQHESYRKKTFKVKDFSERKIRNSFGQSEYRFVIKTTVRLFDQEITAEFTLADRERMRYPVLLGKSFLQGKFIVDVSRNNLSQKYKIKSKS